MSRKFTKFPSNYMRASYTPDYDPAEAFSSIDSLSRTVQELAQKMNNAYQENDTSKANEIREHIIFLLENKETLFKAYNLEK